MGKVPWDSEREKKLLVSIHSSHKLDMAAVAEAMDDGTSAAAIKQHVNALRRTMTDGDADTEKATIASPKRIQPQKK